MSLDLSTAERTTYSKRKGDKLPSIKKWWFFYFYIKKISFLYNL